MDKILITGGTGLLGRTVVDQLLQLNKQVSILSSRDNAGAPAGTELHIGDLTNRNGLAEAVKNAGTIIHCASNPSNYQEVDVTGTKNLLHAIQKGKPAHLIYISIVGIDKSEYPYYKAKLEVEKIITDSGIPFSILRTTQFHDFVYNMIGMLVKNAGSTLPVPSGMRFQSIDISEVAGALVSLCNKAPAGLLEDFGGPQILTFEDMVTAYLNTIHGTQIKIQPEAIQGPRYDLFRSGVNLCPGKTIGKINWADFLKNRLLKNYS